MITLYLITVSKYFGMTCNRIFLQHCIKWSFVLILPSKGHDLHLCECYIHIPLTLSPTSRSIYTLITVQQFITPEYHVCGVLFSLVLFLSSLNKFHCCLLVFIHTYLSSILSSRQLATQQGSFLTSRKQVQPPTAQLSQHQAGSSIESKVCIALEHLFYGSVMQ